MERLAAEEKYGSVHFLLVNLDGLEKAKAYAEAQGLEGRCPHGAGKVPGAYGVRYIPHKVLIGKGGKVLKNYNDFKWSDIDAALSVTVAPSGEDVSSDVEDEKLCGKGCGRPRFRHYATCCRRCEGSSGPHAKDCDERFAPLCENGCGRRPFKHHKTCCTHCSGAEGPHARGCDEKNGKVRPTGDAGDAAALGKLFGQELLGGGKRLSVAEALAGCQAIGILFTATW
mmetsp:Transcript_11712/g.26128  ORF Transcript_11712/g.26128 Transcript_11712/m.26128 type:complete len:227 (+) Transcript_11712:222-902(+)